MYQIYLKKLGGEATSDWNGLPIGPSDPYPLFTSLRYLFLIIYIQVAIVFIMLDVFLFIYLFSILFLLLYIAYINDHNCLFFNM